MHTEPSKIWPKWDEEINRFGEWMLVGSIACIALPPILGILGICGLFYSASTRASVTAKPLFAERDLLRKKEKEGKLTDEEKIRFDFLVGELRRGSKFRDAKIYAVGYIAFTAASFYLGAKLLNMPPSQWLEKSFWGRG